MQIHPSLLRFVIALILALPLFLVARSAAAQQADVIRGHITGRDGVAIAGVRVTVTSVSGNVSRTARTDNSGRFTVIFPGGEGDYFVSLAILGFAPKRYEIKRSADEEILIADATMNTAVTQLDTVQVGTGRKPPPRGIATPDISGTEHNVDVRNVDPAQQGDLAAMAASIPGVTLVPGADGDPSGFSVLGLSPDQNATTLNGMSYNGSNVPRDAGISTSVVTNPYDVSRGGFAGAQLNVRSQPGSNYITRYTSANVDAPALQWTDASGRALGQQYNNVSLGGRVSGPLVFDKAFYNLAFQAGRRASDLRSLISTDALGLQSAGVSLDSVTRLVSILNQARVPLVAPQIGSSRQTDQASLFGSFDFAPPSSTPGTAVNVTVSANLMGLSPAGSMNTEVPAHGGDRKSAQGALQVGHSTYFGVGILSETQASVSTSANHGDPFTALPSASVLVGSTFADGSSVVRNIGFGGNAFLGTRQSTTTAGLMNQLSWFSTNNKHRIKLTSEFRNDAYSQDQTTNALGTFTFNSLADLGANQPASFTRQLSRRVRSGSDRIEALSLGDAYRPTTELQLQYGLRLDANQFSTQPVVNPDVARIFGTSNDRVPSHAYVSPRLGFSWAYGTGAQVAAFAGAARGPRAVVRGGVGVFQSVPQATLIGGALDNTGLPGSIQQVFCVGPATPIPDWSAYIADISSIPSSCVDGTSGTPFANTAPSVTLFDRSYTAPRSVRSNLQWNGAVLNNRFNATFEGVLSVNQHQPSFVDLNFNGVQQFALPGEANRPVYVSPASIVAGTGSIGGTAGRVSPLFSRVTELRSDLTSQSRQFTVRLSPAGFNTHFAWSLAYILSSVREQTRGFTSASGDPRDIEQSRSAFDSRHQITYSIVYNAFDWVRMTWFGNLRSGTPFTPQVAGDINGDGYSNDRAFIFDQGKNPDPVATAIHSLVTSGSSEARHCLASQLGQIARRNSCQGPWTSTASLSFAFNPLKVRLPQRAQLSFAVSNPLGAADLLLHGENNLRGWGQMAIPDQTLLYVRGFDPVSRSYKYDVNQRFGATNAAFSAIRAPVTLTAMLRVDIGPSRERQLLTQQLDRGRTQPGQKVSETILKITHGSVDVPNPMSALLQQADTLHLTGRQADSLATLNRWYSIKRDSVWDPVSKYLAALPDRYDQGEAYARYRRAREASVDLLIPLVPKVRGLLTPAQLRLLPDYIRAYLDTQYLSSIRSGTMGVGGNASLFPSPPQGGGQTFIMR